MSENKKYTFKTIPRVANPRISLQETKNQFFVTFGDDNGFPNKLIDLVNYSSIHGTCVNATVEAIVGNGLTSNYPETLDFANTEGESWNDIFKKVAKDLKLFGGFALEIIWSKDRSRIAEVYQIDFSYLRAKEKNLRGKIPGYYIWDEWNSVHSYVNQSLKDVPYLPAFNPLKKKEEPSQIYVYQAYRPGMKYYPLPDYVGALKVIELDAQVDNFHLNNISNGVVPSLSITTFTNANDEEREAIEMMLRSQYGGTDNAGSLFYMDVDSPENAPVITPIQSNGTDEYYTTINDLITQKILTAHRITSPMMLGIKTEGQLGGRQETIDAFLLFTNTVVKPFQQAILDCFDTIFKINFANDYILGVEQLKLYSDGTEEADVVVGQNAEVGEDSTLETEIEIADRVNDPNVNQVGQEQNFTNETLKSLSGREYQGMMRILNQFSKDKLTKEQATVMLSNAYGLSKEDIDIMLGINDEEEIIN